MRFPPGLWILAAVLGAGAALQSFGLRARLPGAERVRMAATEGEVRDLADALQKTRDEVYGAYGTPGTIFDDTFRRGEEETMEVSLRGKTLRMKKTKLDSLRSVLLQPGYSDDSVILRALSNINPRRLQFDPRYYQYGGLYLYSAGAAIQLAGWAGLFHISRDTRYYFLNPGDLGTLYLMPRILGVAASAAAAALLFLIGSRFCASPRAGLLAALFLAACPVVAVMNHVIKPHTFVLPFSILAMFFSLRVLEEGRLRDYLLGGVCAGLATGAIFFGGFAAFSLAAAHFLREWPARKSGALADRRLWLGALAAGAAFFCVSPFQLLSAGSVLADAQRQVGGDVPRAFFLQNLFVHYFVQFPRALGWGLWLLCTAGLAHAARKGDRVDAVLLAPAALLYLFLCLSPGSERYAMVLYPSLLMVAARRVDAVLSSGRARGAVLAGLAVCVLYTAGYSLYYGALLSRGDPRDPAGRWINENVPHGASIATRERLVYGAGDYPAFRLLDYDMLRWGPHLGSRPDYYLALGEGDAPGAAPPPWGDSYRKVAEFRRDFGWADRLYANHLMGMLDRPLAVYCASGGASGAPSGAGSDPA